MCNLNAAFVPFVFRITMRLVLNTHHIASLPATGKFFVPIYVYEKWKTSIFNIFMCLKEKNKCSVVVDGSCVTIRHRYLQTPSSGLN